MRCKRIFMLTEMLITLNEEDVAQVAQMFARHLLEKVERFKCRARHFFQKMEIAL